MLKKIVFTAKFLYAFTSLIRDPTRLDLVLNLGDDLNTQDPLGEIPLLRKRPEVVRFLAEELRQVNADFSELRKLPEGTLGRTFVTQMEAWGLNPKAPYHTLPDTTDIAKFKVHMEQTHDLWHILTGFGVDVKGEIGLQAFYIAQLWTPLSFALVSVGFLHMLFFKLNEGQQLLSEVARGWWLGKQSKPLFGVDWNQYWHKPLAEVRREFNLQTEQSHSTVPGGDIGDAPLRAA